MGLKTEDFDFELPPEQIAQVPAASRSGSRLLVVDRAAKSLSHQSFEDFASHLRPGDCLVVNNSRVLKARLYARNEKTGGSFELLLLEAVAPNQWWVMLRPGRRARIGTELRLTTPSGEFSSIHAQVEAINEEGHRRLRFSGTNDLLSELELLGQIPLPPYIRRDPQDRSAVDQVRYQTVFAREGGSVAAPTAGLHFTPEILSRLQSQGIELVELTLHVGLGTFSPVKVSQLEDHRMHQESFIITEKAAEKINRAKKNSGRVVAVGTTSLRALESAADDQGVVRPGMGRTALFLYPPADFRVVDALLTNFHLPRSTLLMLVSAFAAPGKVEGRELILRAYGEAVRRGYRFFSYGDAMLIL